ncbi:MAG: DMT family transporter [Xanthobacteraceae bacterium]|nr:DMT family transporter [Xanthobacteraceae bacterium]MBY0613007.1 DMT family transporter [Beijerinckiaceae bacterium]
MTKGVAYGIIAAGTWAAFSVAARVGIDSGLNAWDLTAIRFIVAGFVLLPVMIRRGVYDLGGIGWGRGAVLAIGAGPLFSLLYTYGLSVTPFAHGPVISPSVVTIGTIGLAAVLLGERPSMVRILGVLIVITGLVLVAGSRSDGAGIGQLSVLDLVFVVSGLLWASYTINLRRWKLDPLGATAAVAVISMLVMLPAYAATANVAKLVAAPGAVAIQAFMQGILAAVIAVIAFNNAVKHLGPSKAGLFPSLVPMLAVLLGIPVLGEWPNGAQTFGIILATIGLVLAIGLFDRGRN